MQWKLLIKVCTKIVCLLIKFISFHYFHSLLLLPSFPIAIGTDEKRGYRNVWHSVNSTLFIQMHKHMRTSCSENKTMQSNKTFMSFQCECAIFIAMLSRFLVWSTSWNPSIWNGFAFVFIVSIDLIFFIRASIEFLFLFLSTRQNTHIHTNQKPIH